MFQNVIQLYIIYVIKNKEDIKSDAEAIALIYQKIPKEEINDNKSVEENVILYWYKHEDELSEYFRKGEI